MKIQGMANSRRTQDGMQPEARNRALRDDQRQNSEGCDELYAASLVLSPPHPACGHPLPRGEGLGGAGGEGAGAEGRAHAKLIMLSSIYRIETRGLHSRRWCHWQDRHQSRRETWATQQGQNEKGFETEGMPFAKRLSLWRHPSNSPVA